MCVRLAPACVECVPCRTFVTRSSDLVVLVPSPPQILDYLLVDRSDPIATEPDISQASFNMIKYATSAGLFLGMSEEVRQAAGLLERLETRIMGGPSQQWQSVSCPRVCACVVSGS